VRKSNPPALRVVFVGCETPENAGFLARTMKNFGFHSLYLVTPCDQVRERGAKTAMHANDLLSRSVISEDIETALQGCNLAVGTSSIRPSSSLGVLRTYFTPREFGDAWASTTGTTALVFGREGSGLSNRELDMCDYLVNIPTSRRYSSLNISHAATILLYEAANSAGIVRGGRKLATPNQRVLILRTLKAALEKTAMPRHRRLIAERAVRNILGRSGVSKREAGILLGTVRRLYLNLPDRSD
jgi:TrmH family RNA methyltransferase